RLRARMRWVAARANRCEYGQRYAEADLLRSGGTPQEVEQLAAGAKNLPPAERAALAFARQMTLYASSVTDEDVQELVDEFGERTVVAMILQLAYANFQDRLLTTLGIAVEPGGPLPPLEITFVRPPPDQKPEPVERPPLPENPGIEAPQKVTDS